MFETFRELHEVLYKMPAFNKYITSSLFCIQIAFAFYFIII